MTLQDAYKNKLKAKWDQAEGRGDQAEGKVKENVGKIKEKMADVAINIQEKIEDITD